MNSSARLTSWLRAHWRPLAAALALLLAFALGRASVRPPKIEAHATETAQTHEEQHRQQEAKAETHADTAAASTASLAAHHRVHRRRVIVTRPDGSSTDTRDTTVDDGLTLETAQEVVVELQTASLVLGAIDLSRDTAAAREVEVVQTPQEAPRWGLTALGGLSTDGPVYGAQGGYRLAGPVWLRAQVTGGAAWQGLVGVGVDL